LPFIRRREIQGGSEGERAREKRKEAKEGKLQGEAEGG
jgi:hypothetical protein